MRYQEPVIQSIGSAKHQITAGAGDKFTNVCADSGQNVPNDPRQTSGAYEVDE